MQFLFSRDIVNTWPPDISFTHSVKSKVQNAMRIIKKRKGNFPGSVFVTELNITIIQWSAARIKASGWKEQKERTTTLLRAMLGLGTREINPKSSAIKL